MSEMKPGDVEVPPEQTTTSEMKPGGVEVPPEQTTTSSAAPIPNVAMNSQEKQGSKCCGCCCDFRRAVVIISIIFIVLGIAGLIGALVSLPLISAGFNDDEVAEFWEENSLKNAAILSGISIVTGICALVGAKIFNIYLVGFNILWIIGNYIAGVILSINLIEASNEEFADKEGYVQYNPTYVVYVAQGIISILFIYPHAGFIYEVKKGILSEETYPREEFSCCCVDRRR